MKTARVQEDGTPVYDVRYVPEVGRPTRPMDAETFVDPEAFAADTAERRMRRFERVSVRTGNGSGRCTRGFGGR